MRITELPMMMIRCIELIDEAIAGHKDEAMRELLARDRDKAIELAKDACVDRYLEDLAAEEQRRGELHN
jgi:hypothetical protein